MEASAITTDQTPVFYWKISTMKIIFEIIKLIS